jgi:predicted ArsR family transcriptional regulator
MRVAIDPNDQNFLEQLHRMCGGTIQEICDAVGVTATAVRQRLGRLEAQGLVIHEVVRAGRGRPHHVFRVGDEGLRHLGENYRDLALILWRSIHRIEDETARSAVLRQVQDEFVRQYGRVTSEGPIRDRMLQLQQALASNGYDVEIGDGELPVLRENSCPYQDLASIDPSICEMEADVYSRILNAEVSLTQCCLDGHSCCEFHVQELTSTESDS